MNKKEIKLQNTKQNNNFVESNNMDSYSNLNSNKKGKNIKMTYFNTPSNINNGSQYSNSYTSGTDKGVYNFNSINNSSKIKKTSIKEKTLKNQLNELRKKKNIK